MIKWFIFYAISNTVIFAVSLLVGVALVAMTGTFYYLLLLASPFVAVLYALAMGRFFGVGREIGIYEISVFLSVLLPVLLAVTGNIDLAANINPIYAVTAIMVLVTWFAAGEKASQ